MHLARSLAPLAMALFTLGACAAPEDGADTTEASSDLVAKDAPSNFRVVRPGLYRGGHPSTAGMAFLKARGVERIVNLEVGDFIEATPASISSELRDADAAGITELRYPMSAFEPALSSRFDTQMDAILAVLKTATPEHPVYVHCKHGQDRTGLVIGLERALGEGWAPDAAFDEMVADGFHKYFIGLDEYFERKTGFKE